MYIFKCFRALWVHRFSGTNVKKSNYKKQLTHRVMRAPVALGPLSRCSVCLVGHSALWITVTVNTFCSPVEIIVTIKLWQMIPARWTLFTPIKHFSFSFFYHIFWKQWHSCSNPHLMSNGWNRTLPETLFQRLLCQEKKDAGRNTGTWFKMFRRSGAYSWLQQVPYYCGI